MILEGNDVKTIYNGLMSLLNKKFNIVSWIDSHTVIICYNDGYHDVYEKEDVGELLNTIEFKENK